MPPAGACLDAEGNVGDCKLGAFTNEMVVALLEELLLEEEGPPPAPPPASLLPSVVVELLLILPLQPVLPRYLGTNGSQISVLEQEDCNKR